MGLLDQMLEDTRKSIKDNTFIFEKHNDEIIKSKEKRKTADYDESSDEVRMIKSLGLSIDEYEPQNPEDGYYDAKEYYYCSNDRWKVYIRNLMYDPDLGTILQVLELTDKTTEEKVDFYCDLWCGNTSEHKLEQLKILLSSSVVDYKMIEFGYYYTLPKLLKERGYEVYENDFNFDMYKCLGGLTINKPSVGNNKCCITIDHYFGKVFNIEEITTNDYHPDKISYPFSYNGEQDIDELCKCIDKLIEHLDGKVGYFENGLFYTNRDIKAFFKLYEKDFESLNCTTDAFEYAYGYNESPTDEETEEYLRMCNLVSINHYNGAEIYKKYELVLNRNSYYFGGIVNTYIFEIIYNTKIDKDNCILNITHTISSYIGNNHNDQSEEFKNEIDEKINKETIKGTYIEVMATLVNFLNELVEINKNEK